MTCPPTPPRRRLLAAAALLPLAAPVPGLAAGEPLRIGLLPFLSPRTLMLAFQPLREHLERTLEMPVEMATARDFRAMAQAVQQGEFDLALLPAHLARLAAADWRWQPVAQTMERMELLLLAAPDGPARTPAELAGRAIGTLDELTLTAMAGQRWVVELRLARAPTFVTVPSVSSGVVQLARGEVAALVVAESQLQTLPPQAQQQVRTLARMGTMPGPVWIARPGMERSAARRLGEALLAFPGDPTRPVTAANPRMREVDLAALAGLDTLLPVLRQFLSAPR